MAPPAMASHRTSAAQTMYETVELVELIITHLDIDDIVRCSRTCKYLNTVIFSSTTIKKQLFIDIAHAGNPSAPGEEFHENPKIDYDRPTSNRLEIHPFCIRCLPNANPDAEPILYFNLQSLNEVTSDRWATFLRSDFRQMYPTNPSRPLLNVAIFAREFRKVVVDGELMEQDLVFVACVCVSTANLGQLACVAKLLALNFPWKGDRWEGNWEGQVGEVQEWPLQGHLLGSAEENEEATGILVSDAIWSVELDAMLTRTTMEGAGDN